MPNSRTAALPQYLKKYVTAQNYERYTAVEHATWRYIMRQNQAFFKEHAAPVYLEGLVKTGISTDRIPRIAEMNECLNKFGWGAVPVEGFIPPNAFLDFQARGVLPIACDMRTLAHLAYTPAPDIVHEAAGHAPILADPDYADYLHRYAALAQRAIFSEDDIRLYEAIRALSDFKENPDKSREDIRYAEEKLVQVSQSIKHISEAMKVARMNWWTVEYGLVGKLDAPLIYGAGLLSSIGESQNCLSPQVKKLPLSVLCVETAYNITEPQPQLFVAKSMSQLSDVLADFEKTLAYTRGGLYGVTEAIRAATVTTTTLDSGVQITGVLSTVQNEDEEISFLRWTGPVQLAFRDKEIPGQGRERHAGGFSMPLGRWERALKFDLGKEIAVEYANGIRLTGTPIAVIREDGKVLLITFSQCKIQRGSELLYNPEWGEMDLVVAESVTAVSAGLRSLLPEAELTVGNISTRPGRSSPFTQTELALFDCYQSVRTARDQKQSADEIAKIALTKFPDEWLLHLELAELSAQLTPVVAAEVKSRLTTITKNRPDLAELITKGLKQTA